MSKICDQLNRYLDGELSETQDKEFRLHLPSCRDCPGRLEAALQLTALIAEAAPPDTGSTPASPTATSPAPRPFKPRWMRRTLSGAALAAAGMVAVLVVPLPELVGFPHSDRRTQDAWLTSNGGSYRELKGNPLADHPAPEQLDVGLLLWLTLRRDDLRIAEAYLARGNVQAAEGYLEVAAPSPGVEVAQALVARSRSHPGLALQLLEDVLAADPAHRQARWARALVLKDLQLSLAAADEFQKIANLKEPGWSEEAHERAQRLREEGQRDATEWLQAWARARELTATGGPVPAPEEVKQLPGMWRAVFYDAVRAADSTEALEKLEPVAAELDRRAGDQGGQGILTGYLKQVKTRFSPGRAALAVGYRKLLAGSLQGPGVTALLKAARDKGEADIELGILHRGKLAAANWERFVELVKKSKDPWFDLIQVTELSNQEMVAGKLAAAEQGLRRAADGCRGTGLLFRCAHLEQVLVDVYTRLHLPEQALDHARKGWELTKQIHEWGLQMQFLQHLGQITRLRRQLPLMHAYLSEASAQIAGRPTVICLTRNQIHELLASEALMRLRPDDALRELAQDPECNQLSLFRGMLLVESARQRRDTSGLPAARAELARLLAGEVPDEAQNEGERLLARFYIAEAERQEGAPSAVQALEDIIRSAGGLVDDPSALKARSAAYASLVRDAGRRGALADIIRRAAGERGLPEPARCALALDAEDEMVAFAGRDAAGALFGRYREDLPERFGSVRGLVPADVVERLRGCPEVEVLARSTMFGQAGLLPADVAWSYRLRSKQVIQRAAARRLVVTGVQAPGYLELPVLDDWHTGPDAGAVQLRGADATPDRVLEEMQGADEIVINAHGMAESDISDASIIVLSPDPAEDGRYALQADDVRKRPFSRSPVVVLGACFAAKTAPYPHVPLGLPSAFIEAGAGAVLASAAKLPDVDQSVFFDAVLRRIRTGQSPATAVRDERRTWASKPGGEWTADVLVFE